MVNIFPKVHEVRSHQVSPKPKKVQKRVKTSSRESVPTAAATTTVPAATAAVARLEIFNLGSRINECEDLVSRRGRCLGHGVGHEIS